MWSKVGMGGEPNRYYKHTQISSKSERWPKIPGWFDTEWLTSKISVFMSPNGMQDPSTATFLRSLESMNINLLMKSAIDRIQEIMIARVTTRGVIICLRWNEYVANCYKLIHCILKSMRSLSQEIGTKKRSIHCRWWNPLHQWHNQSSNTGQDIQHHCRYH